jgi:hypothetical protein
MTLIYAARAVLLIGSLIAHLGPENLAATDARVLGCDLPLAKLEGIFLRALQIREPAVVLLGPNGRVIASNNARIATGTLLPPQDIERAEATLDVTAGQPSRLPWKLISLGK